MLCKWMGWYRKIGLSAISLMLVLSVSGCSDTPLEGTQDKEIKSKAQPFQQVNLENEEEIISICIDIYERAVAEKKTDDLEMVRSIVNWLGENGYPAVDSRNQIDMVEAEQVVRFCEMVDAKREAEITIIEVTYLGGFVKYDLHAKDGKVDVARSYYRYENGSIQKKVTGNYQAEDYTEDDFGEINFYDMYDILYQKINASFVPYIADDNSGVGAVYRIPRDEFESVIMAYFNIDSETLQSKTTYYTEDETYEYKPRGFYETEYPEYPYSEVVGFVENGDGTITLTVHVVFPYAGDSNVYVHEVVVRPLKDDGVQYVSNRIIHTENNYEVTWHTPRLTEEEWEEMYGDEKKQLDSKELPAAEQLEKGYDLLIDDRDREKAEADCKAVMEMVKEIYILADKGNASNVVISDNTMLQMKEVIKETGNPVTSSEQYAVMENDKEMEFFLHSIMEGKKGKIVMYEIYSYGGIGRMEYIFDGSDLYLLAANAIWSKKNQPEIACLSYTRIKEWKYTDKGWFSYELCVPEYPEVTEIVDGSSLVRVKPLPEECRELSEKCVFLLGYQGNNLLCSNWDTNSLEDLDYNGMYEYLYWMKNGEPFNPENYPSGIPAEEFERVIMEYLPVTAEQIREWAVFDEGDKTYAWERLGCMNYAPTFFGLSLPEVIGIKKREDGTVTLMVEAVCDMVICDDAVITHELTVRFAEDGSFQYLGNKILNDGIKDIPMYEYRLKSVCLFPYIHIR